MTEQGKYLCPHCLKEHPREVDYCPEKELAVVETYRLEGEVIDDKYRIDEKIGTGGMGVVYKATHLNIGRPLAVKFLHFDLQTSETIATRFKNEARAAASVGHKNIVDIIDMGKLRDKFHYIVMEYIEGEDLRSILDRSGRLPIHEAAQIAMQILSGLRAVHAKNILHRDLKPDNIFIITEPDEEKFVKIVDFGICRVTQDVLSSAKKLTMEGVVCGTPTYMAPEAAKGSEDMDHRADLYSVGTMLYEMVTGRPPFISPSVIELFHKIITEAAKSPHELDPSIPVEFSDAVMKSLAKNPDDRFQNASDFIDAIGVFSSKHLNEMLARKEISPPQEISIPAEYVTGEKTDAEISVQLVVNEDLLTKLLPAAPAAPKESDEISITISEEIKVPLAPEPPSQTQQIEARAQPEAQPLPEPAAQPQTPAQPAPFEYRTAQTMEPPAAKPTPEPPAAEPAPQAPDEARLPTQPALASAQAMAARRPTAPAGEIKPATAKEPAKKKRRGSSAFYVILLILVSAGAFCYYDMQHSRRILNIVKSMIQKTAGTAGPAEDAVEEADAAAEEKVQAYAADLPDAAAPAAEEDAEGAGEEYDGSEIYAADEAGEEMEETTDAAEQEAAARTWNIKAHKKAAGKTPRTKKKKAKAKKGMEYVSD